jgi:hypothetical protein
MMRTVSGTWKHESLFTRPVVESMLAWLGVLAIASLVFTGLYLIVASLE